MIASFLGRWKVTQAAFNTTSNFLHLQLRGLGDEGDDDTAEPVDDAPLLMPFGLGVKPIVQSTLRVLGFRFGDEVWPIKIWDKSQQPTDLEDGETRVYGVGENTARLRCRGNGDITLEAKDGQALTVQANHASIVIDANGGITATPASGQAFTVNANNASAVLDANGGITLTSASGQAFTVHANNGSAAVDANGAIRLTAASGQNITLNQGTNGVARLNDAVQVKIPANSFVVSVAGQAQGTLNSSDVTVSGQITAASGTVLAGG